MNYVPAFIATGLIIAFLVTLALIPNILAWLKERRLAKQRRRRHKR
jgi:UDP-N-acetylmuramyl pentapeptide phosphotransferase/UDP-N-acetylglucosamine-1-phosphate transferase